MPEARPPPPTGSTIMSARSPSSWSSTSRATLAWPSMMSSWSKGGTSGAPSRSENALAAARQSSKKSPTSSISTAPLPKVRVLSIFCCGVVTGMNTRPFRPKCRQAKAKPCAWLPAEAQQKAPSASPAAMRFRMKLKAPRIL